MAVEPLRETITALVSGEGSVCGDEETGAPEIDDLQKVVNCWLLDFNYYVALKAFRAGNYQAFNGLRDFTQALLAQPLRKSKMNIKHIRVMQFLSRINEGQNLDCCFDVEDGLTPLESALDVFDEMQDVFWSEEVAETLRIAITEAAVIVCIKAKNYDRASKILKTFGNKDPKIQKLKSILKVIEDHQDHSHPVLKCFSYENFRRMMLQALESQTEMSEPFLLKEAKNAFKYLDAEDTDSEQSEPGYEQIPAVASVVEPNDQNEIITNGQSPRNKRRKDDGKIPLQDSEDHELAHKSKKQALTVSRLVLEEDSTCEEASEVPESFQKPSDDPVPKALRVSLHNHHAVPEKHRPGFRNSDTIEEKETWSEEDFLFSNRKSGRTSPTGSISVCNGKKQKWTVEESDWVKKGVEKYGEGSWTLILKSYPFIGRTSVMIKDRYRTMKKLSLI
ncbi:telomeric repeat-binding factor 2 isoform X2 [Latimeria chalumnae]|uniref:telomeric repeat-binding factor 2 isoform X2 n=1 Tax=Latimeria chalumnae TaxID=7897 RepID=UPI00313E9CC4